MTTNISTPAGQDIRTDIAALMTDLADLALAKHNAAVGLDHKGETAKGYESQSHAYANAAMWLQTVLDAHTA